MKDIRIFVASSKELERERNELAFLVLAKEEAFAARGLRVRLAKWEYVDPKMTEGRTEDRYLDEMYDCDAAFVLFRNIAGMYTREELDKALAKEREGTTRLKAHAILFAADGNADSDEARLRAAMPEGSYGTWNTPEELREAFLGLVDRVAECGGLVEAPSEKYVRKITAFLAADAELAEERNAFADTVLNVNDLLGRPGPPQHPCATEVLRPGERGERARSERDGAGALRHELPDVRAEGNRGHPRAGEGREPEPSALLRVFPRLGRGRGEVAGRGVQGLPQRLRDQAGSLHVPVRRRERAAAGLSAVAGALRGRVGRDIFDRGHADRAGVRGARERAPQVARVAGAGARTVPRGTPAGRDGSGRNGKVRAGAAVCLATPRAVFRRRIPGGHGACQDLGRGLPRTAQGRFEQRHPGQGLPRT